MTTSASAGYSGTPLARKLGLRDGSRVLALDAPSAYRDWLAPLPPGVRFVDSADATVDIAHVFATERDALQAQLHALRAVLRADATVWVSWPKKASKVPTTVSEDVVRELAFPLGYVDVKVCAVDAVWSGLKLVVRKVLR
ncbi:MAG TPA: DUF3052 domain-containing protein [Lysobacter sp.]|nr:DUF3052 domain-containing protein [Lysobacter sp.]